MKQPEATFKQELNEAFAAVFPTAWYSYVKALAKDGVPDLHYQIPGYPGIWVEAKVGDNPLRASQEREIGRLMTAGAQVRVLRLIKSVDTPWLVESQRVVRSAVPAARGTLKIHVEPGPLSYWSIRTQRLFWQSVFGL